MKRRARGFTLVEMMVALVIFLLFVGGVYSIYYTAHAAIERTDAEEDLVQTGRVVLAELSAELTAAVPDPKGLASTMTGTDTDGDPSAPQTDTLSFLTSGHNTAGTDPVGDLTQVSYTRNDGSDGSTPGLYVTETRHPGLEPDGTTPTPRLLTPLVTSFNCLYLTDAGWQTDWSSQTTLPQAVRIELVLQSTGANPRTETLVTTANLAQATDTPTDATGGTSGT